MLRLPVSALRLRVPWRDAALVLAALGFGWLAAAELPSEAAAVDLRLAENFAAGRGLSFDGTTFELPARPLAVVLIGALRTAHLPVEHGALLLGLVAFAVTVWTARRIADQISGQAFCGWLAAVALLGSTLFTTRMLDGTGAGLSLALATLALWWAMGDSAHRTAPALALAVVNGFDALLAPLALVVAARWSSGAWLRRLSWIVAGAALAWALFALLVVGTVTPAAIRLPVPSAAHLLFGELRFGVLALAAALALYAGALGGERRALIATLALWSGLCALVVVTGDGTPHVQLAAAVLAWATVVLAASTAGLVFDAAERWRRPRALAAAVALLVATAPGLVQGLAIRDAALLSRDARNAGRYLARFGLRSETVEVDSAWAALDLVQRVQLANDGGRIGLLLGGADYLVRTGRERHGELEPPAGPAGFVPIRILDAAFRHDRRSPWVTIFAKPESRLGKSGLRAFAAIDLRPPEPGLAVAIDGEFRARPDGLWARSPSAAAFAIENRENPLSAEFVPALLAAPRAAAGGAVFELSADGELLFSSLVLPGDSPERISIRIPRAVTSDSVTLSFSTRRGPSGGDGDDWAVWRDLKIVVQGILPAR